MQPRVLVLPLLTLAAALAGCSDSAPAGDFAADRHDLAANVQGDTTNAYVAASNPNPAGGLPDPLGPAAGCVQDDVPMSPVGPCDPGSSDYTVHFMHLPETTPAAGAYTAYLLLGGSEAEIGPLTFANGMWEVRKAYEGDQSGSAQSIEVRLGELVIASAPATSGKQAFAISMPLMSVNATGSYDGRDLSLTVDGLPEEAAYEGWLVTVAEDGTKTHVESFPVAEGANEFTASTDVGDYQEVHVHVAGTKINVAIADL